MEVGQLLPYLLGGGAVTAIVAALRWGRQDARDSVETASLNQSDAMKLKASALEEMMRIKTEFGRLEAENMRLRAVLRLHGIDPDRSS